MKLKCKSIVQTYLISLVIVASMIAPNSSLACDQVAVGSYQLLSDAVLSPDKHFVLRYNVEAMLKGDGLNLSITSIESKKNINFRTRAQVLFQGASADLSQILLSSALGDHSEFFVYNDEGDRLAQFKLPATNGPEEYVVRVGHDSQNNRWLLATNQRLLSYSFAQNKLKVVYEPQVQQGSGAEWFNFFDKSEPFIFADSGKSLLLLTTTMDGFAKLKSMLHVFDGTSLEKKRIVELQSQSSPLLFSQTHLLFIHEEGGEYDVVDIRSGQVMRLKEKNESVVDSNMPFAPKISSEAFVGPNDSFGFVKASQKIQFYSSDLNLIEEIEVPDFHKWSRVSTAGNGQFLILLDKDQVSPFLFSLRTRQVIRLPQAMNFLAYQYNVPILNNEIFALIFNERLNKSSLFQYSIQGQCLQSLSSRLEGQDLYELMLHQNTTALSYMEQKSLNQYRSLHNKWLSLNLSNKEVWQTSVKKFFDSYLALESITAIKQSYSRIAKWLMVFKPVLESYTADEQETLIDAIAISLSEKLHKTSEYSEISISKLANLFVANLKPLFGLTAEPRTEMVFLKDFEKDPSGKTIQPVVLGSMPIYAPGDESLIKNDFDVLTSEGFYINRDLPDLKLQPDQPKNYSIQWKFNNQIWTAYGKTELLSLKHLINKDLSVKYDQLWSDRRMTGMVVLSPNLGEPMWLVRKYLSYFNDQGFDFGPTKMVWSKDVNSLTDFFRGTFLFPQNIAETNEFKSWFKTLIAKGHLDYWIKEAHSGGNNEVIFVGKKNAVLKGIKNLGNGREEYIYIVYPLGDSFAKEDQVPITNDEFGSWIRERGRTVTPNQLVYINASCWSASKAQQEIISARSSLLVEIPTSISTLTFQNSTQNHLQVLLTSLRNGLNYNQIQKNLEAVKTSDGTKNPYMLPTQAEYEVKVWKGLSSALDYSVTLEKSDGRDRATYDLIF